MLTPKNHSERFRKTIGRLNVISSGCCCAMVTIVLLNACTAPAEWLGALSLVSAIILAAGTLYCSISCMVLSVKLRKIKQQKDNEERIQSDAKADSSFRPLYVEDPFFCKFLES